MRGNLPKRQKQIIQRDHFKYILTPPIFNIYIKIFAKNTRRKEKCEVLIRATAAT